MIKPETFSFLADLIDNNNREWFALNKERYDIARENVLDFVQHLIPELAKIDPLISSEIDPKKSVMRIYRDVRFSKNKDPYKNNFGIWFSAKLKGGNEPGYYLHLQPGKSFVAGGYWMPEAIHLKLIRQELDYNIEDFKTIIEDKKFAKDFKISTAHALKNAPKGYDPSDPNIEYLKLKSFEVLKPIEDQEFFKPSIIAQLKNYYTTIYPLVSFLRNAIDQ
jgi:uncharacterized protein (TIGR02453 family)